MFDITLDTSGWATASAFPPAARGVDGGVRGVKLISIDVRMISFQERNHPARGMPVRCSSPVTGHHADRHEQLM